MKSASKFQIITIAFFVVCILAGVGFFATYKGGGNSNALPAITIWGTFPSDGFTAYISKVNQGLAQTISVAYVEKSPTNFARDFVAALARGQGPDGILIPADMLLPHIDKLTPIPYTALDQRTFKETYIQEGEMYLTTGGTLALPFIIDPLVMYWNRDTYAGAGVASYPKFWDEFTALNGKLSSKDQNGNLRRETAALGDFTNVVNARELLGSLILQQGNPVAVRGSDGVPMSALKSSNGQSWGDPSAALQYFVSFVDPNSPNYSWNRAMPNSKTAFLSGTLATYFGFASELSDIRNKNPNLNFDAAPLPQSRTGGVKAVYGKMYGLSIVRTSAKQNAVYQIFNILTNPANLSGLSQSLYLPSVRRDTIAAGASDPYIALFNASALISRSWFDADPSQSYQIFANMTDAVTSGARSVREAISDASDQYDVVLKQAVQ